MAVEQRRVIVNMYQVVVPEYVRSINFTEEVDEGEEEDEREEKDEEGVQRSPSVQSGRWSRCLCGASCNGREVYLVLRGSCGGCSKL